MKLPVRLATVSLLALTALACGCVLTSAGQSEPEGAAKDGVTSQPEARVQGKWQDRMTALLEGDSATEAFGLFSAGGWSDSGQIMVLLSPDRARRRLVVVPPNKADIAVDRELTEAEIKRLDPLLAESAGLEDVDVTSFDGPEFELVHAVKSPTGQIRVADRLLVRDPGVKPRPRHTAVIDGFQALRRP